MNVFFSELKSDHDRIKSILKKIEKLEDDDSQEKLDWIKKLRFELIPHSRAEEKVMYYRMQDQTREAKILGLEGFEEHHVADILLQELEEDNPNEPLWQAKFSVLKESVEHHIREEESKIFDAFKKGEKRDYEMICDEFLALKETLMDDLPTQVDFGTTPERAARLQL